jgi:hypothetical protein
VKAVKQEPAHKDKAPAAAGGSAAAAGPGHAAKSGAKGKAARPAAAAAGAGAEGASEPAGATPQDAAAAAAAAAAAGSGSGGGASVLSADRVVELLQSHAKGAVKAADMQTLVGRRIRVFWKGDDKWYTGTITVRQARPAAAAGVVPKLLQAVTFGRVCVLSDLASCACCLFTVIHPPLPPSPPSPMRPPSCRSFCRATSAGCSTRLMHAVPPLTLSPPPLPLCPLCLRVNPSGLPQQAAHARDQV